ncbi:hypothetical protein [Brevibacillus agri]|uniref:hypothetical protein n=2 Tax=Brevibacillus agri TaxID=51101 RepID=UPI001EE500AA|nr:hypothetical protein [Brevibacillus agri]MCG5253226.1 hypothetical protein [Brevibacillus agri]WHX31133.1 hypothetical protein QNK09_02380 [Brevibacillus agri]
MKAFFSTLIAGTLMLTTVSPTFANGTIEDGSRQEKISEIRSYINTSVPALIQELEDLKHKDDVTLGKVEKTIDTFFSEHPAPEAFNDPTLSLEDVFPAEVKKINQKYGKNKPLNNINAFMDEKKNSIERSDDKVITIKNDMSEINVYVSQLGEIFVLEVRTVSSNAENQRTSLVQPRALTWEYTDTKRTTGIGYNAQGNKMFTLWAEGSFKYNGKSVEVDTADGDYSRHFWGSTLELTPRKLGEKRTTRVEGYTYAEVYSRLYFEAGFGIRWAQITFNSGSCETLVGSTVDGNMYGTAKTV